MKSLRVLLCLLCFSPFVQAQEPSIFNQDFKGVKSVKFFVTKTDSTGKILEAKSLSQEHFYDSAGKEARVLYYDKGTYYRSDDYFFDSLGRKTMHILWTKEEGNKKFIYTYETKGQFTIVREFHNKEITRTESNYWDTLQGRYIKRAWYGESTTCAPPWQHEFNKDGKLVMTNSYNGFTEYRYDSLGTLNYMLIRQFEDGHCAAYSPFHYQTIYSSGRLSQYVSKWSTTWFAYNEKGFIASQRIRSGSENEINLTEAEYRYY